MRFSPSLAIVALAAVAIAGCREADEPAAVTPDEAGPLVVYSGRSEALVEPLLDRFREATGIEVEARYGTDAELLAAMREEGAASPADVYWANTTGALVEAQSAGLLAQLPDSLLERPDAFAPAGGRWVPATVRFRVLAYSPARVDTAALPTSVLDLPGRQQFRGRIGWTPTYSSFQDFVTVLRVLHGDDSTRAWIEGIKALEPRAYPSNTPMLEALVAGEIDVALTNHYYVFRVLQGGGEGAYDPASTDGVSAPVALHAFATGDAGNLALVTGAGMMETSGRRSAAMRFLSFLLSDTAQSLAAETVHEYPVVGSAPLPAYLLPFDRAMALSPTVDPARMTDLEGTLRILREAELL
jgi:iron(III) transport system substrate-binding protein